MDECEEPAPDYPPFTITITWAPGDSLVIGGDAERLHSWEVRMLLDEALNLIHEDATTDSEVGPGED